jgi:hypothetical protein
MSRTMAKSKAIKLLRQKQEPKIKKLHLIEERTAII